VLINPGIVDQNIERAILRDQRQNRRDVADINACNARIDLLCKIRGCRNVEIRDHNPGARAGKASGDRSPNATRATRHQGAAAIETPEWQGGDHLSVP
jgi:hypothetical protein